MDAAAAGRRLAAPATAALCSACTTIPSALTPASDEAQRLLVLAAVMAGGALLIWLATLALALYAARPRSLPRLRPAQGARLIVALGVALPTVVLAVLLGYGLRLLPQLSQPGAGHAVSITGERWWWRMHYSLPDGGRLETANELHIPAGERVDLWLSSPDVIHSFWAPALSGKLDLIPGVRKRLSLSARDPGRYPGFCAEYCGQGHANMQFDVVALPPAAYADWLAQQAAPRKPPASAAAQAGESLFLAVGCAGCHTVRGTAAVGRIGPDLTHLASRARLGAGRLPLREDTLRRWVAHTQMLKPGVLMPSFEMLPEAQLDALAAYLAELE